MAEQAPAFPGGLAPCFIRGPHTGAAQYNRLEWFPNPRFAGRDPLPALADDLPGTDEEPATLGAHPTRTGRGAKRTADEVSPEPTAKKPRTQEPPAPGSLGEDDGRTEAATPATGSADATPVENRRGTKRGDAESVSESAPAAKRARTDAGQPQTTDADPATTSAPAAEPRTKEPAPSPDADDQNHAQSHVTTEAHGPVWPPGPKAGRGKAEASSPAKFQVGETPDERNARLATYVVVAAAALVAGLGGTAVAIRDARRRARRVAGAE